MWLKPFILSPSVRHRIEVKNILKNVLYIFQIILIPPYIISPCALYICCYIYFLLKIFMPLKCVDPLTI